MTKRPERHSPEQLHEQRQSALQRLDAGAADFETWFVAQFGVRLYPPSVAWYDLEREAYDAERVAMNARHMADGVREWERQREIAQTAWTARRDVRRKARKSLPLTSTGEQK